MEHGASERVKEQSHTGMPVKTEVDKAAQSTACRGVQTNVNYTEEELGLVELVRREPALLVKEEVLEDGWQDIAELHCMQGPSTSSIVGSMNVFDSIGDLDNTLNIKEELGAAGTELAVLQHTETQGTTKQKDIGVVKQERTINHDKTDPILFSGVQEETIKDEWRGSIVLQDSLMEPGTQKSLGYHVKSPQTCNSSKRCATEACISSCDYCQKSFTNKSSLQRHITSVHSRGSYKCRQCNKSFKCELYLMNHTAKVHIAGSQPRIYSCDYCKKMFTHKQGVRQHIANVHASRSYKCDQCNKIFKSNGRLMAHEAKVHPAGAHVQLYRCDQCLKTYTLKRYLARHCMQVHGKESYNCTKCDKEYKCRAYLSNHVRDVHNEQRYECAVCMKIYKSKAALMMHVKSLHVHKSIGAHAQLYRCEQCLKTYNSKKSLAAHCTKVHGKESYKCMKCNKEFKCRAYLQNHVRDVHNEQRYECAVCMKIYKSKGALMMHVERLHPHKSEGLRTQTYTCDYCKKTFSKKFILQRHTKSIHLAAHIHRCGRCNKNFKSSDNLQQHKTSIHGKAQLKCEVCSRVYMSKFSLRRHVKNAHNSKDIQFKSDLRRHEMLDSRPTADDMNVAACTSTQQHNVDVVKEEPSYGELELGPVVFQHMDCNYRPYKEEPQDGLWGLI